jgi:hypothetical protein
MRAHFLLSCRIISDRVLLLLLSTHTHTHSYRKKKKRERERDQMLVTDRFPSPYFSFLFFLIFFSVSSSSTWIVGCRISFLPLFSLSLLFQDSTNPSQTHTQTHWWVGISKMKYTHTQTDKPSVVVSIPQFPLFMGSAPISSSRTGNAFKFDRIGWGVRSHPTTTNRRRKNKLIIRKEKNAWENQMAGQCNGPFSFSIKNLNFFFLFYLSKKNEFRAENGLILINLFQCT